MSTCAKTEYILKENIVFIKQIGMYANCFLVLSSPPLPFSTSSSFSPPSPPPPSISNSPPQLVLFHSTLQHLVSPFSFSLFSNSLWQLPIFFSYSISIFISTIRKKCSSLKILYNKLFNRYIIGIYMFFDDPIPEVLVWEEKSLYVIWLQIFGVMVKI